MSGSLEHSPAHIISKLLISLGVGTEPSASSNWPTYYADEPDTPDSLLVVFDTQGKIDGRTHPDGEQQDKHGIQILIRSPGHAAGYLKARAIAIALDEDVYQNTVTIETETYNVHSISRKGDVLVLGKGHSVDNLNRFTINALVTLKQTS